MKIDPNLEETSIDEINKLISLLNDFKKENINKSRIQTIDLAIAIISSYLSVIALLNKKNYSIRKLKKFIFGSKTEKVSKMNAKKEAETTSESLTQDIQPDSGIAHVGSVDELKTLGQTGKIPLAPAIKIIRPGTGKNGHDKYTGALEINCPLCEGERPGDLCPTCGDLKLQVKPPKIKIKLTGSAPISALKFIYEKSGCICGAQFTGVPPVEFSEIAEGKKYSPSALASIITQKYDMGVPFGSLAKLQSFVGVPVPASTQANKVKDLNPVVSAVFNVLQYHGANSDVIGFDDARIMILKGKKLLDGTYEVINGHGSVFVCKNFGNGNVVILYHLNLQHAGICLKELLKLRVKNIKDLISICDGLPSYIPYAPIGAINTNCNVHSRRNFVYEKIEEADFFSKRMIASYQLIYKNEKHCVDEKLNAEERLLYHQENSTTPMYSMIDLCHFMIKSPNYFLLSQMREQLLIPEHIIPCQPNSELFKSALYILNRKKELTNFLRFAGVPLDTNEVERKVKAIIEIRKKGFFYHTEQSAIFSGQLISLIETAQACNINSFEYLEFIIRHEKEVIAAPENYLPWNYQTTLLYQKKIFKH